MAWCIYYITKIGFCSLFYNKHLWRFLICLFSIELFVMLQIPTFVICLLIYIAPYIYNNNLWCSSIHENEQKHST